MVQARLLSYEVTSRKHEVYELKEFCELSGHKHNLLVSAQNSHTVNCMGTRLRVKDFCLERPSNEESFLRGYVPFRGDSGEDGAYDDQVFCIMGVAARLSFSCESPGKRDYCRDPRKSCVKLGQSYAHDLELAYSARQYDDSDEILHCHYAQKTKIEDSDSFDAPDIPPMIQDF